MIVQEKDPTGTKDGPELECSALAASKCEAIWIQRFSSGPSGIDICAMAWGKKISLSHIAIPTIFNKCMGARMVRREVPGEYHYPQVTDGKM